MSAKLDVGYIPKRILVIQLGPVHEVIQSLPLLNTLRFRFPRCEIAILIESQMIGLLTRHPAPDRLIVAEPGWYKSLEQIKLIKKRLKAFTPDLCFELEGTLAGSLASWLSGAHHRVGFARNNSKSFFTFLNNHRISVGASHPLEKKLNLLELLGIVGSSIDYDLPTIAHEQANARNLCQEHDLLETSFVLIHATPLAQNPDLWKTITNHIGNRWHIPQLLMCKGESDMTLAEDLIRDTDGVVAATPILSFPLAIALMRRSLFFLGTNIDTLHLACAAPTPCVGILNSSKVVPPHCNDPLTHWVELSMGTPADILLACDRIMEKQLAKGKQRRGA